MHKGTYEILTREVYIKRQCYPTNNYIERLWQSLNHHRPNINALIAVLERDIQQRTEGIEKYADHPLFENEGLSGSFDVIMW